MSSADLGEVFLDDLIAGQDFDPDLSENDDADVDSHFDDDASEFSTETIHSVDAKDIYGLPEAPPGDDLRAESENERDENQEFPSESAEKTSKIRKEQNSAPEEDSEPKMDHLPSESAEGTDAPDPVEDPGPGAGAAAAGAAAGAAAAAAAAAEAGEGLPAGEDAIVECVEDTGEHAVDDAGLNIVSVSGAGNLELPPEPAGETMDRWLISSGEQPIPLLPPMISGEDAVDDAGQTTGPGVVLLPLRCCCRLR